MVINQENIQELCCSQLAFIHDELQFECHPDHAQALSASLVAAAAAGEYYNFASHRSRSNKGGTGRRSTNETVS